MRNLFMERSLGMFETLFERHGYRMQTFVGFDDPVSRARQFVNAVDRIAVYNEMPMGMINRMVPQSLFIDPFDDFMDRLIDAETAAHRIHNAVSLWLIE